MRVILSLTLLLSISSCAVTVAYASGTPSSSSATATGDSDKLDAQSMKNLILLEKKYFEHTFDSDTIEGRVERIEQLILGDATKGNPQDRLNKMVTSLVNDGGSLDPVNSNTADAASTAKAPAKNKQVAATPPSAQNGRDLSNDPYANDHDEDPAAGQTSNYPHITNLEKQILGTTYDGQALNARLTRLETKAFGAVSQLPDLSQRTDALERYAENKLKKKPFAGTESADLAAAEFEASGDSPGQNYARNYSGAPQQQAQQRGGGMASQIPRQLVQSLLGIPTFGPGPGQQRPPSSYENTAYEQQSAPQDDPRVFQQDAPGSSEQMLVRVGWCEVHTFGHTYATMHLTQRLRQLNDAVRPGAPKQNDMQLMDDLDKIVAAVQARHPHPDKAIGAKSAGVTQ